MGITGIISAIIVGIILGVLGRLVVPGKQNIPWWLTIIVGIVAAFIGGYIATLFPYGNQNGGVAWFVIVIQVIVAAILVVLAANLWGRRGVRR